MIYQVIYILHKKNPNKKIITPQTNQSLINVIPEQIIKNHSLENLIK